MDICQVIRSVRESKNLSAEQLALALGVETSTLTRAERGERRLSTTLLEQIADYLGLGVTDLYAVVERRVVDQNGREQVASEKFDETMLKLRAILKDCDSSQLDLVLAVVEVIAKSKQ